MISRAMIVKTLKERVKNITDDEAHVVAGLFLDEFSTSLDPEEVVHEIDQKGWHRLRVEDDPGEWVAPIWPARKGDLIATTSHYNDVLPHCAQLRQLEVEINHITREPTKAGTNII
jgi:hypothetical protein